MLHRVVYFRDNFRRAWSHASVGVCNQGGLLRGRWWDARRMHFTGHHIATHIDLYRCTHQFMYTYTDPHTHGVYPETYVRTHRCTRNVV